MEKIRVTVQGILEDLKNGLTRDDIGDKYGLNKTEVKGVFTHAKLKGRKTLKPKEVRYVVVDEEVEEVEDIQTTLEDAIAEVEAIAEAENSEESLVFDN